MLVRRGGRVTFTNRPLGMKEFREGMISGDMTVAGLEREKVTDACKINEQEIRGEGLFWSS